jgi:hypothetical protein
MLQKQLYNGTPNVAVWRVLRKRLHLKVYKLHVYIVQDLEQWKACNTRHTATFAIQL